MPNRSGGECLGTAWTPGTYSTVAFRPTITYTVPSGWANYEDLPGNFLLLPPGADLAGVDAGTSNYVGIYASVAANSLRLQRPASPGVAITRRALPPPCSARPGMDHGPEESMIVGGLKGQVLRRHDGEGLDKV